MSTLPQGFLEVLEGLPMKWLFYIGCSEPASLLVSCTALCSEAAGSCTPSPNLTALTQSQPWYDALVLVLMLMLVLVAAVGVAVAVAAAVAAAAAGVVVVLLLLLLVCVISIVLIHIMFSSSKITRLK